MGGSSNYVPGPSLLMTNNSIANLSNVVSGKVNTYRLLASLVSSVEIKDRLLKVSGDNDY